MALQELDYDVISVKQLTAKRPTLEGGVTHISLRPLSGYASKESESSRKLQTDNALQHSYKGRGL
jgi:hypothetical protein